MSVELYGTEQPGLKLKREKILEISSTFLIIAETYNIEVQTGDEQIESLDSPVYMQIYGTTTNTPKFFLEPKNGLFTKDSTAKFSVSTNNVGEVIIKQKNLLF